MGRILALLVAITSVAFAYELPPNVAKTAKAAKAAAAGKQKTRAAKPPQVQPEPTPAQPVVPLRPSQMPSVPPRVSYQQGKLTVVAENSTLADIFSAIRKATGIKIETQGGPSGDRVAAKIGPASTREVMLSLLQGARYDFVMMGSLNDPNQVERVVLTPRLNALSASAPTQTQAFARQQPPQPAQNPDEGDEENANGDEDPGFAPVRGPDPQPAAQDQSQQPQPGQPPQDQQQPQPGQPAGDLNQQQYPQNQPGQPQADQQQPPNGQQVRSPEELLQDLRRAEQERQHFDPKTRPPQPQ